MNETASTTVHRNTMYARSPFGSAGASLPSSSFRSDVYGGASGAQTNGPIYGVSPPAERRPSDRGGPLSSLSNSASDMTPFTHDMRPAPAIMIRRLSRSIGSEALSSMLIFAGELVDTEFVRSPYPEDQGFATAVARFQSQAGALEAQQKLHGKPNTTKEANMIVEMHGGGMLNSFDRRNTIDSTTPRTQSNSTSSGGSISGPPGRSRFGSTFQSTEKISPPLETPSSGASGEFPTPETSAHFQTLFSAQSPLSNGVDDRHRVSGKYTINNDAADDETGELLKDPVAFAKGGQQTQNQRTANQHIPIARFGSLSLSTSNGSSTSIPLGSPTNSGMTSPRGGAVLQSPISPTNMSSMGPNGYNLNYPRPQYPPVNPADQNPPCNTLYVGNLPIDTSEDELKTIFSKQRGYKRLCFRTKQNGPMCFVEFEDVSFATKTLNELYGHVLHNSVKGGIRLSFSKNPLGVRSGQANGMGPNPAMSPHAMAPGYGGINPAATTFSSVSGPPPGLASPPGLVSPSAFRPPPPQPPPQLLSTGMDGMFSNPFGMLPQEFASQLSPRNLSGGVPPPLNGATFPRENRAAYNDYTLGR